MARKRQDGLGLLDRIVIVVAWLASCGVVFVLGYYVGKESAPRHSGATGGPVSIPIIAPAEPESPEGRGHDFYEYLDQQGARDGTRKATPPAQRSTTTRPRPPTTRPRPTIPPPRSTTTVHRPRTTVPRSTTLPPRSPTTRPRPTIPPPARTAPPPIPDATGPGWTVYVSPTRSRFAAEEERTKLRALGYDATVVRIQRDGDIWYRVRVGRYSSQERAEQVRRQLREQGIGHAFVQSD